MRFFQQTLGVESAAGGWLEVATDKGTWAALKADYCKRFEAPADPPDKFHQDVFGNFGSRGASGIAEQLQNVKIMRLALVSASGTPTATNWSFWQFQALVPSKVGFLV